MSRIFLIIVAFISGLAVITVGCRTAETVAPQITVPAVESTTSPETIFDQELADRQVLEFIRNTSTFRFDGIPSSLSFSSSEFSQISSFKAIVYTVNFQTEHPGHGDRRDLVLARVVTQHTARIYYDQLPNQIRMARCDDIWDLLKDTELPRYISGIVISGGSTARPDGPLDVPHTFIYQVRQADGSIINLSFKGYPPSPAGDAARARMTLEFHAGEILIGDRIYASGILDKETNTIDLSIDGGYIRTAEPKMEVVGQVISGGDTSLERLPDAPRRFEYTLLQENGVKIKVAFSSLPPSARGDIGNAGITLSFYRESIEPGDYLKAFGTYDFRTDTIEVAAKGDFIKTYPVKP
ncbi:MAG TPA: hypothetical protein VLH15_00315 [Dehalococcoidales bacterium]|nr:hypothetical protein [Dehalococcoidales bacterium]